MDFNTVNIEKYYVNIFCNIFETFFFAINSFSNNLYSNCYVNNVVIGKEEKLN